MRTGPLREIRSTLIGLRQKTRRLAFLAGRGRNELPNSTAQHSQRYRPNTNVDIVIMGALKEPGHDQAEKTQKEIIIIATNHIVDWESNIFDTQERHDFSTEEKENLI